MVGVDEQLVEARIVQFLDPLLRPRRSSGSQQPPHSYLRRHAAEHAAAGGVIDVLFENADFVPFMDAPTARAATVGIELTGQGRVWRAASHRWSWEEPAWNATTLALWGCGLGLPRRYPGAAWDTPWSWWSPGEGQVIAHLTSPVWAVATAVLPDGRVIAVTGGDDDTVPLWDLATGTPLGAPLTGHTGPVTAVATAVLPDGRVIAVTGGDDGTVRLWDLAAGTPLGAPLTGHTGTVWAVATAVLPDGRVIAVTSADDATVRLWEVTPRHELIATQPTPRAVSSLALCWVESELVLVTAFGQDVVRLDATNVVRGQQSQTGVARPLPIDLPGAARLSWGQL